MNKKEMFIKEIEDLKLELSKEAMEYFETLKSSKTKEGLTENGKKILKYMQEKNENCNNIFNSKNIADGLNISARSVSGSMRKLISEEYVEKISSNPVTYKITDLGKKYNID